MHRAMSRLRSQAHFLQQHLDACVLQHVRLAACVDDVMSKLLALKEALPPGVDVSGLVTEDPLVLMQDLEVLRSWIGRRV